MTQQATIPAAERRHVAEVELIRAISALAVVLIHVTALPLSTADPFSRSMVFYGFWNQWARFSIPAFVFVSGLVLAHGYAARPLAVGPFFRRRFRAVLVPYLAWSLGYWLFRQLLGGNRTPAGLLAALADLPGELLRGTAMYHLYFLLLIFQFYLLFPLLVRLLTPARMRWALALAFLVQMALHVRSYYVPQPPDLPVVAALWPWQDRLFPHWVFYFTFGLWAGLHLDRFRTWTRRYVWPLGMGAVLTLTWMTGEFLVAVRTPGYTVAAAATSLRPAGLVYSVAAVLLLFALAARLPGLRPWVQGLSRHSYGIYLAHPLFLAGTQVLLPRLGFTGTHLVYLVHLLVAVAGAMTLAVALGRSRWGALLLGRG